MSQDLQGSTPSSDSPLRPSASLDRRQLGRMLMAVTGGLVAGAALSGCGAEEVAEESATDDSLLLKEPHVCRGLNTCKGNGADGANACAGQGTCASAEAHSCSGSNACAGQGGCASTAGRNTCKGRGDCGVPLSHGSWEPTRASFEAQMGAAGREFGDAPKEG